MNEIFHIKTGHEPDATESILLLELGLRHLCYGLLNHSSRQLFQAGYFTAKNGENTFFETAFSTLRLGLPFARVAISHFTPHAMLVPSKFYGDDSSSLFKTVEGPEKSQTVISESIPNWQIHNVFGLDRHLHELLTKKFTSGQYWHTYTVALKNTGQVESPQLVLDFRTKEFSVLLFNDDQLQFAQIFPYTAADDVLYHLLRICQHFSLQQDEVRMSIAGLVEKDSQMHTALVQYFLHASFAEPGEAIPVAESLQEIPSHYLGSLHNLAACVS